LNKLNITHVSLFVVLICLYSLLTNAIHAATSSTSLADPNNVHQVQRGKLIYTRFCAFCHGLELEGQKNWRIRKPDGKLPAPPHDETGHTWHHADDLLFGITKFGLVPPYGPENYQSDMPAWGSTLNDDDIWAVIAYIKSRWPTEQQKIQQQITNESIRH